MAVLPALVTSMVLASSPAMRYSSQLRMESFLRTANLSETQDRAVIEDVVITPRGQVIFYTPRMELKAILEPQLLLRRSFTQPTLEVLTFLFLRGEYQVARGFKTWALESLTYGYFPFEDFRVPAPTDNGGRRLLDASKYAYSESMVGFDYTGIRRTYIGVAGGLVFNGLLDPPTTPHNPKDRMTPAQVSPEVRAQAFHSVTRRFVLGGEIYARDVNFSTDAHLTVAQATPIFQYLFTPLINGRLQIGAAVGESRPQQAEGLPLPNQDILMPIGEAALQTPVPVGYHWPVTAKLAVRYASFVNAYSTAFFPRAEGSFALQWKGRRQAQVDLELSAAQAVTDGPHSRDGEERLSLKIQWPLTRSSAVVASGRLLRLREFLIEDQPIYKWFAGVGLVIRQENGRL
ncbi:hypothetical protein [Hyalangium versicolor]|uniref:hypothetical protein n=1 Tax=Hyalangium versicolor TaxID=2861190 RepID=UPI001CCEC43B|nr:hypothetical protein [Hyalangium versicolor]